MREMEKNLESSTRPLPLLKKQFFECQDSLLWLWKIGTRVEFNLYTWERRSSNWTIGRRIGSLNDDSVATRVGKRRRRNWKISKQLSKSIEKQSHLPFPLSNPTP
jgi:hypothetical protein